MKHRSTNRPLLPAASLVALLLCITAFQARAQTAEHPPGAGIPTGREGGRTPDNLRPPSIRERQIMMRQMEAEAAKPRTPEEEKLALEQIADDYSKIQVVNNKMMSVTIPAKAPDYKYVSESVSDIRKRANRLKLNLRLPKAEGDRPTYNDVTDIPSLKATLLSLDKAIMSFVANPLFKNPDVYDVKHANQLGLDLETILEFTKSLSGDLEKLSKQSRN